MGMYDDIINMPHHVSRSRKHMSNNDRAAQFLPFAALTGYEDAIKETGRVVKEKIILGLEDRELLNQKLSILKAHLRERPPLQITYFKKDEKKDGGSYITDEGLLRNIDEVEKTITLVDGDPIAIIDIYDLKSELFSILEAI